MIRLSPVDTTGNLRLDLAQNRLFFNGLLRCYLRPVPAGMSSYPGRHDRIHRRKQIVQEAGSRAYGIFRNRLTFTMCAWGTGSVGWPLINRLAAGRFCIVGPHAPPAGAFLMRLAEKDTGPS